jgi:hypothetical protein
MGWRERWFGKSDERRESQSLREATPAVALQPTVEDWYWGRAGSSGSEEDYFWRRLSDNWYQKDVIPATYLEIHNQVFEAWNANPLANYIIEMGVNFVLGDGVQISARHKKVQRTIDAFWQDPDNHMDLRIYDLCQELSLYGELFVRFFVNEYSGDVKIVTIDPSLIDQIESDPENIEHELRVHRRPIGPSATVPGQPALLTPLERQNFEGVWFRCPDEVMHFAINKVSNAKRGKSDLATLLPWLRRYKDWLIDRVRVNKYKAAFLWDITLTGADRRTVEAKLQEYARPPEPGSVVVHNENEEWHAVQPNINADDVSADGRAIKLMIAMGAGIPEHWLADGQNTNRASAAEMGMPTIKKYQRRQDYFASVLRAILDRVIREKQQRGLLPKGIDTSYEIIFPDIDASDNLDLARSGYYVCQSLALAQDRGWLSQQTAARLYFEFLGEKINVHAELAAARGEIGGSDPAAGSAEFAHGIEPPPPPRATSDDSATGVADTAGVLDLFPTGEMSSAGSAPTIRRRRTR